MQTEQPDGFCPGTSFPHQYLGTLSFVIFIGMLDKNLISAIFAELG
jgi:hypothetical protein